MNQIESLYLSKTKIDINQNNLSSFEFLATKFNNSFLTEKCSQASILSIEYYSLCFKSISFLPYHSQKLIHNFSFKLNGKIVECNLPFLCCISEKFYSRFIQNSLLPFIEIEIEFNGKEHEKCGLTFINFLKGISFSSIDFSSNVLFTITEELEIIGFDQLLLQEYLIPTTLEESISFLEYSFSSRLKTHFEKSIEIVAFHFYQINVDILENFSFNVLEHILSSPSLKIQNETSLFQILIKFVEPKPNYFALLKYVYLCFVDRTVLDEFFQRFLFMLLISNCFI
jgi:hypothetical protein